VCRAHCHRVIKLSGTLGQFAPEKELVENVHGVRASFLETGEELRKRLQSSTAATDPDPIFGPDAEPAVYFIGKMLWSKGLGSLIELLKYAEESAGIKINVDMYGGGPDKDAASTRAESLNLEMPFHGPLDHAKLAFSHKVSARRHIICFTVCRISSQQNSPFFLLG
jgi:digalactosyldiacylglycerol synthase